MREHDIASDIQELFETKVLWTITKPFNDID